MKYILIILALIVGFFILDKLTDYDGRMKEHNKYMCAVYGYEEDCKTPLPEERRLK